MFFTFWAHWNRLLHEAHTVTSKFPGLVIHSANLQVSPKTTQNVEVGPRPAFLTNSPGCMPTDIENLYSLWKLFLVDVYHFLIKSCSLRWSESGYVFFLTNDPDVINFVCNMLTGL